MTDSPEASINPEPPLRGEQLLVMVYDELRRLAASQLSGQGGGQTLQPTALVHEAWLRLAGTGGSLWKDRTHFFRTAAMAMRNVLVDRVREKTSLKRAGQVEFVLDGGAEVMTAPDDHLLLIDECLEIMERENPECARIVHLKFFAGLSNEETADLLGLSLRSVERQWAFARAKLYQMIRGRAQPEGSTHEANR
jgi:RNA polymerase sigma factor (TIGR02999 family)